MDRRTYCLSQAYISPSQHPVTPTPLTCYWEGFWQVSVPFWTSNLQLKGFAGSVRSSRLNYFRKRPDNLAF